MPENPEALMILLSKLPLIPIGRGALPGHELMYAPILGGWNPKNILDTYLVELANRERVTK